MIIGFKYLKYLILNKKIKKSPALKPQELYVLDGRQGYSILEGRGLNRISDIMKIKHVFYTQLQ